MYPYQPYFNQQTQYQRTEVVKVNGEGGAKAYQMPPNSSVLLLDETAPIVWLKTTDGAGFPSLSPYSITPYKPAPPVDVNGLEQRIARLEEMINAKPDTTNAKRRKSEETQPTMIAQAKQMMSVPGQIQKIKQMIGNGDPKQMFYAACKQYGIDPEDILSELR